MKQAAACRATMLGLLIAGFLSLKTPVQVSADGIPDPRFGVVEAYAAPAAASALGAGWTRITFEWNRVQPNGPEEWNQWPVSDDIVNQELARGREVVGVLNTTPGWATDTDAGAGVPKGLQLPPDDPNNLWATYVRTMVTRYMGRIDHWTIWNEPDIPVSSVDMSWGGSLDDFIRLLQVGYQVAKEANPNAVIHMAAITHHHDQHWLGRFIESIVAQEGAAESSYYFDVATLHLYHEPEKIYDITAHYGGMLRGHGLHKPIWIAETNAYLSRLSPEEQAFFIFQAFSVEIAAGAQRIAVYKMADTETDSAADPEPFGLVQADGTRRPAFTAYRVATSYLSGFRGGSWDRRDDIAVVTIDRGPRTTTVVWARTPDAQTGMIPARRTRALLVDVRGGARTVYPERGYYTIHLPGARCPDGCQIGGEPFMLVEEAPATANTAPTPHPATATATAMPDLTPSGEGDAERTTVPMVAATTAPEDTAASGYPTTPSPTAQPSPAATSTTTPTSTGAPLLTHTNTPLPTHTITPSPGPAITVSPTLPASRVSSSRPTASPVATAMSREPQRSMRSTTPTPLAPSASASFPSNDGSSDYPWILTSVLMLSLSAAAFCMGRSRT